MQKNANITPIQVVTKREMAMDENKELLTIKELIEAASGKDENGYTKSTVGLFS